MTEWPANSPDSLLCKCISYDYDDAGACRGEESAGISIVLAKPKPNGMLGIAAESDESKSCHQRGQLRLSEDPVAISQTGLPDCGWVQAGSYSKSNRTADLT